VYRTFIFFITLKKALKKQLINYINNYIHTIGLNLIMVKICLITISVVLCLIVISLFHPQIMDPYITYDGKVIKARPFASHSIVGSKDYASKSWHTPSGARYYREGCKILPHNQDVIDHRGQLQDTKYVSDVLAGNDGQIPLIEDNGGNEYVGPSYHQPKSVENKEGFWYDMNRLEDKSWYSGKLDDEFKGMINNENDWRNNLIKSNIKRRRWKHTQGKGPGSLSLSEQKSVNRLSQKDSSTIPLIEEGFGNHRAPEDWNEVDYPIVTSNGLNMTPSFPQNGSLLNSMYKHTNIRKLWGEFDMLKPEDPIVNAMEAKQKMKSRTTVSHSKKNS
jgi:hypothetical protein